MITIRSDNGPRNSKAITIRRDYWLWYSLCAIFKKWQLFFTVITNYLIVQKMYHSVTAKMPMMTTNLCAVGEFAPTAWDWNYHISQHNTKRNDSWWCRPLLTICSKLPTYPGWFHTKIACFSVCVQCTYSTRMVAGRSHVVTRTYVIYSFISFSYAWSL